MVVQHLSCRSDGTDDHNGNKRKRFSDEQLSALTDLAEEANWSLLSVAKEVREHFCLKHEISKVSSTSLLLLHTMESRTTFPTPLLKYHVAVRLLTLPCFAR